MIKQREVRLPKNWGKIKYKGKYIDFGNPFNTNNLFFNHIYFQIPFYPLDPIHSCLVSGYWCWRNAWEKPLDVFWYFKEKLKGG